ncbi:hypothetical protein Tco_1069666 [Tanacetum coccineum]|uniref:Integrase, catalytic region, zinc finger, CCHC-type, peptidase aspartic, catalytic n=1 Tax=Tanacetum coccineum TaxID=301880 RepID=A0ABQ5HKB9_9ASTR
MTGNRSKLMNFVEKFIGSIRFGNDHLGAIMGYEDYVMGDSVISRVYYVEGIGHNYSHIGQFVILILSCLQKAYLFCCDIKGGLNKQSDSSVVNGNGNSSTKLCADYLKVLEYCHQKSVRELALQNGVVKDEHGSLIHTRHNKTPYELVHDKKHDLTFFRVFGALARANTNLQQRTSIMETIHVTFNEMHQSMAPVRISSGPEPFIMTPGQLKSGLAPTDKELECFISTYVHFLYTSIVKMHVDKCFIRQQIQIIHHPVQHSRIAEETNHEDTPINQVDGYRSLSGSNKVKVDDMVIGIRIFIAKCCNQTYDQSTHVGFKTAFLNGDFRRSAQGCSIQEEVRQEVLSFLEDRFAQRLGFDFNKFSSVLWITKSAIALCGNKLPDSRFKTHSHTGHHFIREQVEIVGLNSYFVTKVSTGRHSHQSITRGLQPGLMPGHGLLYIHALWGYCKTMNTMAELNVPTQPPTRTDEQIVPRSQWLIIGKSNLLFNAQKIQKNPIFQILVDILSNTNFFKHHLPQQMFAAITCINSGITIKALAINSCHPAQPFELPSSGKTSGSDKPRHPVLQMLWGIVTQSNVDHAELLWEEFTQGIQTFFSHKASHKASLKDPKKKVTPLLIPYGRFSKVIIYYLASKNNIHRRPESAIHHTRDDFILGNIKFVLKGETIEVFGMAIPDHLITEAIQQSSYYPKYLEMVVENTKKTPQESASVQPATKHAPPKKPTTTTLVKQSKPAPAPTKKPSKHKLPQKIRKGKPTFQLVDEDDEAQQESIPQEEGDDPDLELAKKMSLEAHQEKGEGEGDDADMERAIKLSLDPAFLPQGQAPVGGVTIRDPVSETTPKLPEVVGKGKAIVTEEQVAHSLIDLSKKKRTTDQFIFVRCDQTPHDLTTGPSSQPEDDTSEKVIHESSSTSDSERTESETETAAPKGDKDQGETNGHRRSLNPESHSGSMSSMKNLDDTYNFGDQFLYDKPTEDDQEKSKVIEESDSTIPDPSHQTFTSTPPVIAPFTDFSYPKPSSLVTPPPINTEGTTITTSLLEITPFIALQLRVARLEQEMYEVKKIDHSADILERHTADLIEKYFVLPGLESVKNQESKKSLKEIIRTKKEQGEEKQDLTYSIRSTDKVDLEEFDLKSALFKTHE